MTPPYYTRSASHQVQLTRRLQRDMELAEAHSWKHFYEALGQKKDGGQFRDLLLASVPEIDLLLFNRVVGLGMGSMVLDSKIEDLIAHYGTRGVKRFMVQLSPFVIPDNTDLMLKRRKFVHESDWAKLIWRANDHLEMTDAPCEIRRVEEGQEDLYADVMIRSLGWPELLRPALRGSIHKEGFMHYLAWFDGEAVAGGSTFITKNFATLKLAGTLPAYQKRGIHQLLLKRKIKDAIDMGCEWITAETAHMPDGTPNAANSNLKKLGFTEAYKRSNFVYTF
ncbi:MAG: GNAT family N-acetyltransferase [Cyclobacteriaceae bacterium]